MRNSYIRRCLSVTLLVLMGCASAPPPLPEPAPASEAKVQPGDVVKLEVWREPDMSGEYPVDETGSVVLPVVGKWNVSEDTETSLRTRLTEALSESLRNPSVSVTVLRRVKILGAVRQPGLYPLDATMTVGDALATAGGIDGSGQHNRIDIIRMGERYRVDTDHARKLSELQLQSGDVLFVPERSWILRNYPAVLTGLTTLAGLTTLILTYIRTSMTPVGTR